MEMPNIRLRSRKDILSTDDPSLSKEVLAFARKTSKKSREPLTREDQKRFQIRSQLIESPAADPNGFERILGRSDLTGINFLDRGRRAAAAVCRIKLPTDGGASYGTGFLVGSRLLMTNNHVIASRDEAGQAEAEFGYEHDLDGVLAEPVQFNLRPQEIFYTNVDLDITFVAVVPFAENGTPLERFGRLPLLPVSGKAVPGEWVSIIQHPGGQPKQIAIRSSEVLELDPKKVSGINLDNFIHYSTDTEPGSSGAPVFNDQWQVVALHHKAVPAAPQDLKKGESDTRWIANEGVRISAIFRHLNKNRFQSEDANAVLNRLTAALGFLPTPLPAVSESDLASEQYAPFKTSRWTSPDLGYAPDFLSEAIGLDDICKEVRKRKLTVPLLDGSGDELKYQRFSVVMHKRKFAMMTACNIDGALLKKIERKDTWRQDARIAPDCQPDDEFYVKTRQTEKVYFSRGHLVRLLDPSWGTPAEAKRGQEDTFHFTNAAPQVQGYNDSDWGNLEDYILEKAQGTEKKITVFTGPIFLDDDPSYGHRRKGGPWQIPQSFWKIAVLQKTDDTLAAAAFIVGQTEYVKALYEAKVFTGLQPYTIEEMRSRQIQVTVAALEERIKDHSPLDFSVLKQWDALGSLESTRQARWLRSAADVQI
jgi:endonuclease G, mitochondrial